MIFLDTETCGFCGPVVLIQYAIDDGDIILHNVWSEPIYKTLELIEMFCNHSGGIVGFNLAFDWFHMCKIYTMLRLWPDKNEYPDQIVNELAEIEPLARDGPCLKPVTACDLMLFARKGPYQSTMDRGDIRIKKVPTALATELAKELEKRINLSPIYFARRKTKGLPQWQVFDREDEEGEYEPDFKDVVMKFAPSAALKALAVDTGIISAEEVLKFDDVELEDQYPEEYGYAPFAKAVGNEHDWKGAWPIKIRHHITHWGFYDKARKYAADDVRYTRALWHYFKCPPCGDDDSILACMVAAVRWRGFRIDPDAIIKLRSDTIKSKTIKLPNGKDFEVPTEPEKARWYVQEHMDPTEKLIVRDSTKKVLLEEITKWKQDCPDCKGEGCTACGNSGERVHPSAERAQQVLDARSSNYEVNFYDKLLLAGRLHASFSVIGALSSRMSGADGLNTMGVKKEKAVRRCFLLFWDGTVLAGGDFEGFEVTLAEAVYNDPDLRKDLLSGKKIHALFGVHVYPDMTYEQILATSGTKDDRYTRCKSAVFAMFYGGEGFTLKDRLGVDIETADKAYAAFCKRYKMVGQSRKRIFDMFCSMKQVGGIGSRIEWSEPADYIETMFGFRRYFTLENKICKTLYELASKPPKHWTQLKIKVNRRDRLQTASGAVQSALYAAAFAVQASNMRAAANHEIQSAGATITKRVQRAIWDIQPSGIGNWIVEPMNIHDEIECPVAAGYEKLVEKAVYDAVELIRPQVPLISMEWKTGLASWADK